MILLDYKDNRPIYEQVTEKLQELMILGVLEEDSQMPSVRSLAAELSINPNTIQRAYAELERGGFLYSVKGRGSFVGSVRRLKEALKGEIGGKLGVVAKEARQLDMSRAEFVERAGQAYDSCAEGMQTKPESGSAPPPTGGQGPEASPQEGKVQDKGGTKA